MKNLTKEQLLQQLKEEQAKVEHLAEKNSVVFEILERHEDALDSIYHMSDEMMNVFSKERNMTGKQSYKVYKELRKDALNTKCRL